MITIKCEKCGTESSNPYIFENKRYSYILNEPGHHNLVSFHLCSSCQKSLNEKILETQSEFIGVRILSWDEDNGVV